MKPTLMIMTSVLLGAMHASTTMGSISISGHAAETYAVMYGGGSRTDTGTIQGTATDYEYTGITFIVPVFAEVATYAVENRYDGTGSFLVGGRCGIWFVDDWKGWGFAGDLSYSQIDSGPDNTTLNVVPFSIMILYRYPIMVSEDFPSGRLQPHIGVGGALVFGNLSTRIMDARGMSVEESQEAVGLGGSLHAGCTWKLNETVGIFFEYRYLRTKLQGTSSEERDQPYVTEVDLEAPSISAHQLLSGISISF